jgi:hypothetical protein
LHEDLLWWEIDVFTCKHWVSYLNRRKHGANEEQKKKEGKEPRKKRRKEEEKEKGMEKGNE